MPAMRYMMANGCFYGDKESIFPKYDLVAVRQSKDGNYRGHWVTGLGFMDLFFSKEHVRELTPEEIKEYDGKYIYIGDVKCGPLKIT